MAQFRQQLLNLNSSGGELGLPPPLLASVDKLYC